jgi:hypothetical protein
VDKQPLIREAHCLANEAGYPGFRRKYFDDPDAVKEWPEPAARDRGLRAEWEQFAAEYYPDFERRHAGESVESLTRFIAMLRAEVALGDASCYYECTCAAGKIARKEQESRAAEGQQRDGGRER